MTDDDRARVLRRARAGFGHVEGRSDEDCLILRILQMERHTAERNDAMSFVSGQAQMIGKLHLRRLELEAAVEAMTVGAKQ